MYFPENQLLTALASKRGYDLDISPPTEGFSGRCAKLPTSMKVRKYKVIMG